MKSSASRYGRIFGMLVCVGLSACSTKPSLVVESEPSNAYVYIKGDPKLDLPEHKALIGRTPLSTQVIKFKNYSGKQIEKKVNDLLDDGEFFLIIEKDCFESLSTRVPPLPERSLRLQRIANCQPSVSQE